FFFFQAEDGIRDRTVTGVQTCALPIYSPVGALQIGRRSMIVCAALVVAPGSSVYTPQELAGKTVALDYGNGTAYAGLQMLEGARSEERRVGKECGRGGWEGPGKRKLGE